MNPHTLLMKCITLLYREKQLKEGDGSAEIIKSAINTINVSNVSIGIPTDRDITVALINIAKNMLVDTSSEEYDCISLLQSIHLACGIDDKLYASFKQGIDGTLNDSSLKKMVTNLRKDINNYFREYRVGEILSSDSYNFKMNRNKINDFNAFIAEHIAQLEALQITASTGDPAIITEVDIGDDGSMNAVLNELDETNNGEFILKTGWQKLNDMLQGGFRRPSTTSIYGLQHKYKTGFTLSLFRQIAQYNKPTLIDPTKKPLLLRISFEDKTVDNIQFLYQAIKFNETKEPVSILNVPRDEMIGYIRQHLQCNGFHIKMLRVDPTMWSYKSVCNKILELESKGYEVVMLMLDYLAKMPTSGCTHSGPNGSDLRDMFRRLKNFCDAHKIAFITPHQLSSDAKKLIRNGIPEENFVKDIEGKGYTEGSTQIDQEVDLELYIHLFKQGNKAYLAIQRGKHRIPTIAEEYDKYMILPFPKNMPIPDDLYDESPLSYRKLPKAASIDAAMIADFQF